MTRKVSAEVDLVHQQTQNQRYGSSHIGATAKDISNVVTDAASGVVDIFHGIDKAVAEDRKSGSAGMPRPISYAVFCLKKKNRRRTANHHRHEVPARQASEAAAQHQHQATVVSSIVGVTAPDKFRYFFFYCCGDHRDLHSFPTRRSSDLTAKDISNVVTDAASGVVDIFHGIDKAVADTWNNFWKDGKADGIGSNLSRK